MTFTLPILPDACRRILDKKPRVREACAEASAHLYATHALWRWTEGRFQEAQKLNWIPQLLCEVPGPWLVLNCLEMFWGMWAVKGCCVEFGG